MRDSRSDEARASPGLGLAGLAFAAGFLVRLVPYPRVFAGGGSVRFPEGADELYHMRRIWYDVVRFPEALDFDPYVAFPDGGRAVSPLFFDRVHAAVARLLAGASDLHAVERVVAWSPPLCGAFAVAVVAWLGARLFSPRAGLIAGLLLAFLPAHWLNSQLAMIDHHAAATAIVSLLLSACCGLALAKDARTRAALAVAGGLATALALHVWTGSLLHVLTLEVLLTAQLLATADRRTAASRAAALALLHAVALPFLLPSAFAEPRPHLGRLSPLVLSLLQPLWLGAAAALYTGLALACRYERLGATRLVRFAVAAALGVTGVGVAFAALPELRAVFGQGSRWFTGSEAGLAVIVELRPLLTPLGSFTPDLAHLHFGYAFWLLPFVVLGVAWSERGSEHSPAVWLLAAWSAVFLVATLNQIRFADQFCLGYVLFAGAAFDRAASSSRSRLALASAALAVLFLPWVGFHRDAIAASLGVSPRAHAPDRKARVEEAARWLRDHSPPTAGYLDASVAPEYGVLSAWGDGHQVRYYAERPVVQDNIGVYAGAGPFEQAGAYYAARDEETAHAIARALRVRYVFAGANGSGQAPLLPSGRSHGLALWGALGSAAELRLGPRALALPALERHRLVYVAGAAAIATRPTLAMAERVAVFEVVEGARVSGAAPDGSRVVFDLAFEGGPGRYRATAVARDGRYALRLPYATDSASGALRPRGPYRVRCAGRTAELSLAEAAVATGAAVVGPEFPGGG